MIDPEPADAYLPPRYLEQLHANAQTIVCRYCHAEIGKPCVNRSLDVATPTKVPHARRITDSQEVPF